MSCELVSEYVSKLTFEAAGGRFKRGREGSRTPFEILADGLATGLADDINLWWEWERSSHGRRQMVWSRGLKKLAGVDEITDEDAAAEDAGGRTLIVLPRLTWQAVYPVAVELLEATETGGLSAAMHWLDERDLVYEVRDP
ncbi:MAG: hypothetical protein LC721_02040 [Actinobacteria bacterium]|nr:hypothetical protein [Actinomycetota bacterium]